MISQSQLRHFMLIAQEGSFARAAELANITQPALSNSLRALETRVGFRLIERSERPVRVTRLGERILARAERILFESRNLDREVQHLADGHGGRICFGLPAIFSTSLGGAIVAEFHAKHPKVRLDVIVRDATELSEMLLDEQLDFSVVDANDPPRDPSLKLTEMPALRGGAFCRADHPILSIPNPTAKDLRKYHFATTFLRDHALRDFRARLVIRDASAIFVAVNSLNISMLHDATEQSDLILLTTPGCVRNALRFGVLREIPFDLGISGQWAIAELRDQVIHPAAADLVSTIIEVATRESDTTSAPS